MTEAFKLSTSEQQFGQGATDSQVVRLAEHVVNNMPGTTAKIAALMLSNANNEQVIDDITKIAISVVPDDKKSTLNPRTYSGDQPLIG